jgi:hypothetical protein
LEQTQGLDELRMLWSNPKTRKILLEKLDNAGFGKDELDTLKKLIDAEKSDLFDVLKYVFDSNFQPITRQNRAFKAKAKIWLSLNQNQQDFIEWQPCVEFLFPCRLLVLFLLFWNKHRGFAHIYHKLVVAP